MKNAYRLVAVASLALGAAFPVWAEVDVPNMTCGDFMAMDAAGQSTAADALLRWASSTENASSCGTIPSQLGCGTGDKMEKSEVSSLITTHCTGKDASANVIEQLRNADM